MATDLSNGATAGDTAGDKVKEDAALEWMREQEAAGMSNRALGQMLGCSHRTVGRGKPSSNRPEMTQGLRNLIEAHIETTGWQPQAAAATDAADSDADDAVDDGEDAAVDADVADDALARGDLGRNGAGGDADSGQGNSLPIGRTGRNAMGDAVVVVDGVAENGAADADVDGAAVDYADKPADAEAQSVDAEADAGGEGEWTDSAEQDWDDDWNEGETADATVDGDSAEQDDDWADDESDVEQEEAQETAPSIGETPAAAASDVEREERAQAEADSRERRRAMLGEEDARILRRRRQERIERVKAAYVTRWMREHNAKQTNASRQRHTRRLAIRRRAEGIRNIIEASSVTELVSLFARALEEPLAGMYPRQAPEADKARERESDMQVEPDVVAISEPGVSSTFTRRARWRELGSPEIRRLKGDALAALMRTPVLKELRLEEAERVARSMLERKLTLLAPPRQLRGDFRKSLVTGESVHYFDAGAKRVASTRGSEPIGNGMRMEDIRAGILPQHRMRRYARASHYGRPFKIGRRFSDVIPDSPYPDEDWFFGSVGWIDDNGLWRPSRAELIARWRNARALYEDWDARSEQNPWHYWLYEERATLELGLLHPDYAMTFARLIYGSARWPTTTRVGWETKARLKQIQANRRRMRRMLRRRRWRGILLWLPAMPLRLLEGVVRSMRRPYIVHTHRRLETGRRGAYGRFMRRFGAMFSSKKRRQYALLSKPVVAFERSSVVMPALYGDVSEQRLLTRIVSWLLYRRYSELDGSVCGSADWTVTDPPLTPDYMTPHPRTGYIPSEAFRKRFRHHEYEIGYQPPQPAVEGGGSRMMTAFRWALRSAWLALKAPYLVVRWATRAVRRFTASDDTALPDAAEHVASRMSKEQFEAAVAAESRAIYTKNLSVESGRKARPRRGR